MAAPAIVDLIDTRDCEACGQLDVVTWPDAYLDNDGRFEKVRMVALVDRLTGSGRDAGVSQLRIMGNMDWAYGDTPNAPDLIAYEGEVNEMTSLSSRGRCVMDALRTHPLTLTNGILQESPFFTSLPR